MKERPNRPSEHHLTTERELHIQELLAWGHVFNAAGMLANNRGQPEDALWDRLRCPAGVTGCCGSFKPRQPDPASNVSSARLHSKAPNCQRERYHHEN